MDTQQGPTPPAGMPPPVWDPNLGQWVYYTPAPQPPQKKKKSPLKIIMWVVLGLVLFLLVDGLLSGNSTPAPVAPAPTTQSAPYQTGVVPAPPRLTNPPTTQHTVTYQVVTTGPGDVDITYMTANYNSSQANGVPAPWEHSVSMDSQNTYGSVTAQRKSNMNGTVTVRVIIDGHQVSEQTSSGQYAVVSASGQE